MGSYNEFLKGRGKNRADALANAWQEYVFENGHRCSLRDTESAKLVGTVPPIRPFIEKREFKQPTWPYQTVTHEIHSSRPDPTAPKSEWMEEWEFEVWVHS